MVQKSNLKHITEASDEAIAAYPNDKGWEPTMHGYVQLLEVRAAFDAGRASAPSPLPAEGVAELTRDFKTTEGLAREGETITHRLAEVIRRGYEALDDGTRGTGTPAFHLLHEGMSELGQIQSIWSIMSNGLSHPAPSDEELTKFLNDGISYFEIHATGEVGEWWLSQIKRVFDPARAVAAPTQ